MHSALLYFVLVSFHTLELHANPRLFLSHSLPHIPNQTSVMVTWISFAILFVHSASSICVLDHISIEICKGTLRCL